MLPSHIRTFDENILWITIQRDVILNISKDCFLIIHLGKLITETISLEQIDKDIGSLYHVFQNSEGDYFIEISPNDKRLLTEIVHTDLVWECGNLLNIAVFSEKPRFPDDNLSFEKAEAVMHSFYDNLGFNIRVSDEKNNDLKVCERVNSVLENYRIIRG